MAKPRLLTPKEFGETFDPPKHANSIIRLLHGNRIPGAEKVGGVWVIPEGSRIKGGGRRAKHGNTTGIGAKEFARKHGRSISRTYQLLTAGRVEGATRTIHGWDIPDDAEWPADDGF